VKEQTFSHKPVQKEFIQKIRPRIEQCLNEGGKCPILPDFAHILITANKTESLS